MIKVYDKNDLELCEVHEFTYSGTFMASAYVSFTIENEKPIQFSIGDYLDYRGERFVLTYIPSKQKNSSIGSTDSAFKYSDVKFTFIADELSTCSFLDYVPSDNNVHFTGLPKFSFFGTVFNLAERIKANLDRKYYSVLSGLVNASGYEVIGTSTLFLTELKNGDRIKIDGIERIVTDVQTNTRATVSLPFVTALSGKKVTHYLWNIEIASGFTSAEKNINVDKISCFDALALFNKEYNTNYVINNRNVLVGANGNTISKNFKYGKGNGLISINQSTNADAQIITRLRVFGSSKNIPTRWYNNQINPSTNQPYIPNFMYVPYLVLPNFLSNGGDSYIDAGTDDKVYDGGIASTTNYQTILDGQDATPEPTNKIVDGGNAFSHSRYIDKYGIREGVVYFDGQGDNALDIYPTIEGMTKAQLTAAGVTVTSAPNDNGNLDEIYSCTNPTDNGNIPTDGTSLVSTFKLELKDMGFDLSEKLADGSYKYASTDGEMTISMKSGKCSARNFVIAKDGIVKKTNAGFITYELTCQREVDDNIGQAFPNNVYPLLAGEKFVIVNIQMPDVYIQAAMQRLLIAGNEYLNKNNTSKFIYSPEIDNIFMARNESIANELRVGSLFSFEDNDLPVSDSVVIKTLEIKEGSSLIPQYSIVLNNENTATTVEKITNKIDNVQVIVDSVSANKNEVGYTHIAYADDAQGSGLSKYPNGKYYIGFYVDNYQFDSIDPQRYSWSLIKGEQGDVGASVSYRGVYDATLIPAKIYHGGRTYRDAVYYNGLYYITKTDAGDFSNILPTDTSKWELYGAQFSSIATDTLLANGANIADFIFRKGDNFSRMQSYRGIAKINGQWVESNDIYNDTFIPHLSLDGVNGAIDINSTKTSITGGLTTNSKTTISINQSDGYISAKDEANGTSYFSPLGVFSNSARQYAFSVGNIASPDSYGAIVGIGFRNESINKDPLDNSYLFSSGVIGRDGFSYNKGTAPYFGGFFEMLKANGMCISCKQIDSNYSMSRYDTMLSCYNATDITVTMPPNPYAGQMVYIRQNNPQYITLSTSDGIQFQSGTYGISPTFIQGTRYSIASFIYDGQYWLANWGN